MVYIVGAGNDGKGVLRFDTASGVWSTLGATSSIKLGCATFVVGVERYYVVTDTWMALADMLESRCSFGAATIGST
jgi:lipid-binding SYLF domain-containing protein